MGCAVVQREIPIQIAIKDAIRVLIDRRLLSYRLFRVNTFRFRSRESRRSRGSTWGVLCRIPN